MLILLTLLTLLATKFVGFPTKEFSCSLVDTNWIPNLIQKPSTQRVSDRTGEGLSPKSRLAPVLLTN